MVSVFCRFIPNTCTPAPHCSPPGLGSRRWGTMGFKWFNRRTTARHPRRRDSRVGPVRAGAISAWEGSTVSIEGESTFTDNSVLEDGGELDALGSPPLAVPSLLRR